jgi:hypothetical protein
MTNAVIRERETSELLCSRLDRLLDSPLFVRERISAVQAAARGGAALDPHLIVLLASHAAFAHDVAAGRGAAGQGSASRAGDVTSQAV